MSRPRECICFQQLAGAVQMLHAADAAISVVVMLLRNSGVTGVSVLHPVLTAIDVVFVGDIGTIAIFHLFQHAVLAEVGVATQYHTGTPACRNSTTGEMGKQVWLRSGKINILPERVNRCNTLNYL